jgi:hypothetical protein
MTDLRNALPQLAKDIAGRSIRDSHWLSVVGRFRPGATVQHAEAEFNTIADRFRPLYPENHLC